MGKNNLPYVSIIVPIYNEAQYISLCLESLINLNYPQTRYEIIVVDNGSTDETMQIVERYATRYNVKIYICPSTTIAGVRNYGAKKAKGTILAFIDADCVADRNWLLNAIKSLQRELCVTGSQVQIPREATWIEKAWFSQTKSGRYNAPYINSANLIVPTEIFNKIGGFNEALITGEDYEFCIRAKKVANVISDSKIKVIHLRNPKHLFDFLKREMWHGLGAFGSFKIAWFDKPLLATILFMLLSVLQIIGFVCILTGGPKYIFGYASISIFFLITMTVLYRFLKYKMRFTRILQLMLLYYFYYLGRSISIMCIFYSRIQLLLGYNTERNYNK